jgi:hypothetical protein
MLFQKFIFSCKKIFIYLKENREKNKNSKELAKDIWREGLYILIKIMYIKVSLKI